MSSTLTPASAPLARQARERFVAHMEGVLPPLTAAVRDLLLNQMSAAKSGRDIQQRRDALVDFEQTAGKWVDAVARAWRRAMIPPPAAGNARLELASLELIGDDVVENKILASRLAMAVQEKVVWDLNDLKLRITHLEGGEELGSEDVLRPEALSQILVEQWAAMNLTREAWIHSKDVIQQFIVPRALESYQQANEFLVDSGVLPHIDPSARVKRSAGQADRPAPTHAPDAGAPAGAPSGAGPMADSFFTPAQVMSEPGGGPDAGSGTPLAKARARAGGVLGQLKRLLRDKVGGQEGGTPTPPSASLVAAVTHHATQVQTQVQTRVNEAMTLGDIVIFDDDAVEQVALDLRSRSHDLKQKAASSSEKATIEIVALMFQSILAEERIPPAVRVWFARLQMPVLRVALAEPEFFGSLEHPARQLIDRMGSCVLGFDAVQISGSALETEIRRVVQVIEQYPETGRRVFQLVYDEFQRFLSRFLTEKGPGQKLVSVAQQVEQKETNAIQYTIELRKMLSDVPVRDEIREFLFKVWAEVLAVAAVKNGPQHQETLALKKSASDLVWAASAKPNRDDRAKVIQDLPELLARLRRGMTMLGLDSADQENHIKVIGDTLADAFLSKTEAIPHARIEEMTRRLANLEDFVSDDDAGELPLDQESIEMMLGIDASMIEVISVGGAQPSGAMMAWANELQLGNWFTLDHNGRMAQVQYAWRSERRQLHLFASGEGYCYLMPLRRLASYLQANLLVPTEEEALTVRATRDALAKLDANPERLLQ
jgi:hypothetical protein